MKSKVTIVLVFSAIAFCAGMAKVFRGVVTVGYPYSIDGISLEMDRITVAAKFKKLGLGPSSRTSDEEIWGGRVFEEKISVDFEGNRAKTIRIDSAAAKSVHSLPVIRKDNQEAFRLKPDSIESDVVQALGEPVGREGSKLSFMAQRGYSIRVAFVQNQIKFVEGNRLEKYGRPIIDDYSSKDDIDRTIGKPLQGESNQDYSTYRLDNSVLHVYYSEGMIESMSLNNPSVH